MLQKFRDVPSPIEYQELRARARAHTQTHTHTPCSLACKGLYHLLSRDKDFTP